MNLHHPLLAATLLSLVLCGSEPLATAATTGPVRCLILGQDTAPSRTHAHVLMRDLGRDAIWFDFASNPAHATADFIARFDAVLLDAPRDTFPGLAGLANSRQVMAPDFSSPEADWAPGVRRQVLDSLSESRRKDWTDFLARREPERREPSPTIANYERRPEPITFQHPFSVQGSIDRTQVPIDLRLELFAAEPDIAKPIALAWDERGRLWVNETRDYPHDVKTSGEGNDSIKICEDTNGDGRADKFTVFAEGLNIPTSLVFVHGGVIVAQPPRLLLLKDTNGDDRADTREVIMEGWGIGDTHAQANNLHYGHDNWLYGCVGYSGFRGTVGGKELRFAQGTFRFKADGSALEFLHQFSNNSWGHSANAAGDQFGGTANGAPLFYGGIPATLAPAGMRVMSARKINVEDRCHTITPNFRQVDVFGGYTAAAGSAFIESANLPPRLQGMALICEPTMKTISLMDVRPKGAGYVAHDGFNLVASSDEWMSPVFAEVGPDGAVWFADWQNFIIQHNPTPSRQRGGYEAKTGVGGAHENPLRDHQRGRVYRVVWEKARKSPAPNLAQAPTTRLVESLTHDVQTVRLTAQRLLVDGKRADAIPRLKLLVTATNTTPAAGIASIHALWTLHGLGALDDATHRTALLARDPALRRNAVRALARDAHAQSLYFSSGVISDPDLLTRLAALAKLGEFATTPDIQTAIKALARKPEHADDEWLAEVGRLLARVHQVEAYREGPNLLPNPGFETTGADGLPEGWKRRDYQNLPANNEARWTVVGDAGQIRAGTRAVMGSSPGRADTSLYADVTLKPNTQYRLSGWVRSRGLQGKLSLNDHINRVETELLTAANGDWTRVETVFRNGSATRGSINILFVARGEGWFDDVNLCELLPLEETTVAAGPGDPARGQNLFYKHTAACILCHQLKGEGSTVGPALDGIAARQTADYLRESLLEPSKQLAKGFEQLTLSPMPPMTDIFNAQEIADLLAFIQTLK